MSDNQAGQETRWWEYYFVRYFVGSVAGAVAIVALSNLPGLRLDRLGVPLIRDFSSIGIKEISGLAALGFAYCYIASAPMLLLHATLAQLGLNPLRFRWKYWALTVAGVVLIYLGAAYRLSIGFRNQQSWGLLLFLAVFGVQIAMIVNAHVNRFHGITSFYVRLATLRASDRPSAREYVESYRHLREHGNAYSILVLELALTLVLVAASTPGLIAAVLVLWLLPSTYSWFIGTLLESRLDQASST